MAERAAPYGHKEFIIYDAMPGKLTALNDRFANITLRAFKKYCLSTMGFWTNNVSTSNGLRYLLAFKDAAHRQQAWAEFRTETGPDGPIVKYIQNTTLRPTNSSPMQ